MEITTGTTHNKGIILFHKKHRIGIGYITYERWKLHNTKAKSWHFCYKSYPPNSSENFNTTVVARFIQLTIKGCTIAYMKYR